MGLLSREQGCSRVSQCEIHLLVIQVESIEV